MEWSVCLIKNTNEAAVRRGIQRKEGERLGMTIIWSKGEINSSPSLVTFSWMLLSWMFIGEVSVSGMLSLSLSLPGGRDWWTQHPYPLLHHHTSPPPHPFSSLSLSPSHSSSSPPLHHHSTTITVSWEHSQPFNHPHPLLPSVPFPSLCSSNKGWWWLWRPTQLQNEQLIDYELHITLTIPTTTSSFMHRQHN